MQNKKSFTSLLNTTASYPFVRGDAVNYQSVWVYACVRSISNNIASVPFKLKDKAGRVLSDKKDKWVYLFSRPNPILNSMELLWQHTISNYELRGEVFWLFNDANLKPSNKPSRIDVVQSASPIYSPANNDVQIGWKVGTSDYTLDNCIRFANIAPTGGVNVVSGKTIARQAISLDTAIHDYNQVFFDNGAQINGYLLDKGDSGNLDEDEIRRIRNAWDASFSGTGNAHKTPVLTGGLEYVSTGSTHKDMDFENLNKMVKEEILAAFGVPASQLSVGDASYASAKIADRQFFTNNLIPKMNYFTSVLNSTILYLTGYECYFDFTTIEPLKEERSAKMQGAKDLFELGFSINEINAIQKLGMDAIPDEWANKPVDAREVKTKLKDTTQANKPEPPNNNQQVAQDNVQPKPQ